MSKETKSDTRSETSQKSAKASQTADSQMHKETAQGFRGVEVDSTPNENYTVAGVTSGAPTPETDVDAAASARKDTGLGMSALESAEREKTQRGEK